MAIRTDLKRAIIISLIVGWAIGVGGVLLGFALFGFVLCP